MSVKLRHDVGRISEAHPAIAKIREIASAAGPASRTYRAKATLLEGMDAA